MSNSQGFNRLHKGVQRWIWEQKWTELRDIQEQAIEPILSGACDVVISASTAAGKTEAAFLPACSRIARSSRASPIARLASKRLEMGTGLRHTPPSYPTSLEFVILHRQGRHERCSDHGSPT